MPEGKEPVGRHQRLFGRALLESPLARDGSPSAPGAAGAPVRPECGPDPRPWRSGSWHVYHGIMPADAPRRACPTCGTPVPALADTCPRCGMPAASSRGGAQDEESAAARTAVARRKGGADLLFLGGLLLGGPVMTVGDHLRLGLFLVLAGGFASVLRRYAGASLGGAVALGAAGAALVAAVVVSPPEADAAGSAGEEARTAYIAELAEDYEPDGRVEARGPCLITAWFFLPEQGSPRCGSVPPGPVREHLAELGFKRVVVSDRSEAGSVCSFEP